MKHNLSLIVVVMAVALIGASGCGEQPGKPPKLAVVDTPSTKENTPPKPGGQDNTLAPKNNLQKPQTTNPPKNFTNSIGMKFVWIPPGAFVMGSPPEEKGRRQIENQHRVTLTKGFYMGVNPVTQVQWQAVMSTNPSFFRGQSNLPVEWVSWDDCQQFVQKLREKDGKPYRLPSEAEWEYACRAGTTTPFYFGETMSTDQANYFSDAPRSDGKVASRSGTTPVGSFPANSWGLYDMHGDVSEWCQDWYSADARQDAVDPQGPPTGQFRVVRGGSFMHSVFNCRSAQILKLEPDSRASNCGCRICFFVE